MSRGDLAERLGLSAATTTRTVRPLIEAGLIEEQPPVEVAGPGRPTRLLAVVPSVPPLQASSSQMTASTPS